MKSARCEDSTTKFLSLHLCLTHKEILIHSSTMPFIAGTPEALLARNDSKNPATTCKGITSSGRPCRRALAANAPRSSSSTPPKKNTKKQNGVLAVQTDNEIDGSRAAAFFCWQHKDQAEKLGRQGTQLLPLKEQNSIDDLVGKIGVLDIDENTNADPKRKGKKGPRRVHTAGNDQAQGEIPAQWHNVQGPIMSVPTNAMPPPRPPPRPAQYEPGTIPHAKSNIGLFCCLRSVDDGEDSMPMARPQQNPYAQQQQQQQGSWNRPPEMAHVTGGTAGGGLRPPTQEQQQHSSRPTTPPRPQRPAAQTHGSGSSHTQNLLSLLPADLSPQTTSALLAELGKPISKKDEEGYIYMFWVSPEDEAEAASTNTRSLFHPSHNHTSPVSQRDSTLIVPPAWLTATQQAALNTSDPHTSFLSDTNTTFSSGSGSDAFTTLLDETDHIEASIPGYNDPYVSARSIHSHSQPTNSTPQPKKTVLLKIGRANNVHRRLNEWTRQCSRNLTLVRFYPYSPSSNSHPQPTPQTPIAQKVPYVHKVERLIHLELAERRVRNLGPCERCGREHKEWFEVEARRERVVAVDEVIRRWCAWAEGVKG